MATVDKHRKFGKVWHVIFKICEQIYKHTRLEMCNYLWNGILRTSRQAQHARFVCLGLFGTEL